MPVLNVDPIAGDHAALAVGRRTFRIRHRVDGLRIDRTEGERDDLLEGNRLAGDETYRVR